MKRIIEPPSDNVLGHIYLKLVSLPYLFRDKVAEECRWSTPTFYRKQRLVAGLSNAEKEKIIEVFDEMLKDFTHICDKYRRPKW